jgi:nucleotide-binding universal stress UspA family protein
MQTWLVAHDFSPNADEAARVAARDLLAMKDGGTIILCHVYQVMPMPTGVNGAGVVALERAVAMESSQQLEKIAVELRKTIDEARAQMQGAPVVEVEIVVRQDAPADGILAEARQRRATRILTGTHGRRGISHLLLGSVAERVVRLADVPVLVVKEVRS